MRIKKISSDKVTVYLSRQDLEFFDFCPGDTVPQSGDLHKFLFDIMEVIQTETGFDPYHGGQVVVEAVHSPDGMRLNIRKIGMVKQEKLTRSQFEKIKSVKVCDASSSKAVRNRLLKVLEQLQAESKGVSEIHKTEYETFIFSDFAALEAGLCMLDDDTAEKCVLYRNNERYALVARIERYSKEYNLLSEYAVICRGGDVLAADIREGWKELAREDKLAEMAEAMRNMI